MSNKSTCQELAKQFLIAQKELSLIRYAGEWYTYHPKTGWLMTTDGDVEDRIGKFFWNKPVNLSGSFTKNVAGCVRTVFSGIEPLDETMEPTLWLDFKNGELRVRHAHGWLATRSHHIHVPTVVQALYRGEGIPPDAIRPADSSLFSQGVVPCDFDVHATCPKWEKFVSEVCPDDALTLQRMFGLALTYDRSYNVFFVLHGESGTGKSTALKVLALLCSGTVCGVPLNRFGERFDPYWLSRYRANIMYDLPSVREGFGSVADREAVLKSCTCGEKFQVEKKGRDAVYRYLTALPIFGCNTLPRFADRSMAISNRMRIIEFPHVFCNTAAHDSGLYEKLSAELPGILLWALRGYGSLLCCGSHVFPETAQAAKIKEELIRSTRPDELFCDECLEVVDDPKVVLSTKAAYDAFYEYAQRCGIRDPEVMGIVIPNMVRHLGVKKAKASYKGRRVACLYGVRFRDDRDEERPTPLSKTPQKRVYHPNTQ